MPFRPRNSTTGQSDIDSSHCGCSSLSPHILVVVLINSTRFWILFHSEDKTGMYEIVASSLRSYLVEKCLVFMDYCIQATQFFLLWPSHRQNLNYSSLMNIHFRLCQKIELVIIDSCSSAQVNDINNILEFSCILHSAVLFIVHSLAR